MGLLVDGVWQDEAHEVRTKDGRFVRPTTRYRNWVTADGSAGPSGDSGFPAARGRYHLYVALACPWAHRTVIFRALKGLEDVVSMSVVEPLYGPHGRTFGSPRARRLTRSTARASLPRSISSRTRSSPAASPSRRCGTRSGARSLTMNRPRSSGCSIRSSADSPT